MSTAASPREGSLSPTIIEGIEFPAGLEVSWDNHQLHFKKGQKFVTDLLMNRILRHERSKELSSVDLGLCFKITDATLAMLSDVPTIRYLNFAGCFNITDRGVTALSKLPSLNHLTLYRCQRITDASVKAARHFTGLTNLVRLILYYCGGITKSSLPTLCTLPNLAEINCRYTRVTKGFGVVFFGNGGKTKIIAGDK